MKTNYNSFYHLQIAKCGGTYLNNMVVDPLSSILEKNNVNFIDGRPHDGWQNIENNYVLSCLRDPVKRTVSHYAYYKKINEKKIFLKPILNFFTWLEINKNIISNYQTKNFLYQKKQGHLNIFDSTYGFDKDFLTIKIDKNLAFDRIKNVNILLKDTQLKYKTCNIIKDKILKSFNIKDNFYIDNKKQYDHNVTKNSLEIYNNLTKKQIDDIYNLNNLDSELYFSEFIYFIK